MIVTSGTDKLLHKRGLSFQPGNSERSEDRLSAKLPRLLAKSGLFGYGKTKAADKDPKSPLPPFRALSLTACTTDTWLSHGKGRFGTS